MRILLLLLCALWVTSVCSFFDGACPRKDPPPGVVVLYVGNRLDLTCSGDVKVNGVKIINGSNSNKRRNLFGISPTPRVENNSAVSTNRDKTPTKSAVSEEYHSTTTETGVNIMSAENENLNYTDTEYTTTPQMIRSTTTSTTAENESDWEEDEMVTEGDFDHEIEEGIRVTRGTKSKPCWMWKKLGEKGDRDWGKTTFSRDGSALSLASVTLADSAKYTCHYRGRETFAVKVIVADPPETPSLSCYKKSPSSKIRCEWRPQKPIHKRPNCHLLLSTSFPHSPNFKQIPCSFSSNLSHCWCALENIYDEHRVIHTAFLCVTSIEGNATSSLMYFTPLDILKPDPPSQVSVQLEQGQTLTVTWKLPKYWQQRDNFYRITYELKYRPSKSSNDQVTEIKGRSSYTITDALPGVEYLIQLRNREEYDGQWSEWSEPIYVRTPIVAEPDLETTMTSLTLQDDYGSGFPPMTYPDDLTSNPVCSNLFCEASHVLWIVVVSAILSVILAFYIYRHKNKLLSKLHSLRAVTPHRDLSPPPTPAVRPPEGEALMISVPQLYKRCLQNDTQEGEENEEGQTVTRIIDPIHLNNKSYFFLES